MIYRVKELKEKYKDYYSLNKAIDSGELFKVGHGLYSDENPLISELENLFAKYPNAVLTTRSAFAYYDMSDYVPDKYYVATSQNAHKINIPKVKQIYMTSNILNIGKQKVKTKYGVINIYDKERLLIELLRYKNRFDYSYYKEIVNSYRELAKNEKLDYHKLSKYCSMFSNGDSLMKKILEVIL